MQRRLKARVAAATTGAAALVSGLLVPVTNIASDHTPGWGESPEVLWTAFGVLTLASASLTVLGRRLDAPAAAGPATVTDPAPVSRLAGTPQDSLRPPYVEPERVRGRTAELERLDALLRRPDGRFAVLCAAGGFGKTTVAAALAHRAREKGYAVFWIRWRDIEGLAKQMTQVAMECGLPQEELKSVESGRTSLPDLVWRQLGCSRRWLLVVDNVDQANQLSPTDEEVAEYRGWVRPDGGGLLLVTSRDMSAEAWGDRVCMVSLDSLDDESAAQALCDKAPESGSRSEAASLARRLGGLPLALHTVSTYLARPASRYRSFAEYEAALDGELVSLLGARSPQASDPEVARRVVRHTWELSLDQLESEGARWARPLMLVLSLFADAPISRELVDVGLLRAVTGERVKETELEDAFSGLERYGLIEFSGPTQGAEPGTLQMHSLIREITALSLISPDVDLTRWRSAVVKRLLEVGEKVTPDRSHWPTARAVADHSQLIFESRDLATYGRCQAVKRRLLTALYAAGEYSAAVSVTRAAHESDARLFGPDHVRTLKSRYELARALNYRGRHAEAVQLHREVLERRAATLGPRHYRTVQSMDAYAIALSHLGHHEEGIRLLHEALEHRMRTSGPDALDTMATRNNLANALNTSGKHAEAVRMHQEILEQRVRAFGPDDYRTVQSRHNLATAMDDLGQHEEAIVLFREVLAQRSRRQGLEHLATVGSRHNLGKALSRLGRHAEAVELLEQVLEQRGRLLGPDHPQTVYARVLLESAVARRRGGGRYRPGRWPLVRWLARRRPGAEPG